MLLFICWLFPIFKIHIDFNNYVENDASLLTNQIPEIRFRDGQVYTDVEQPYQVISPETQGVFAVIDTTGLINSIDEANSRVLLTKHELIIQKSRIENRAFSLRGVENYLVNSEIVYGWLDTLSQYLGIILFIICLLSSYLFRMGLSLFFALIGFIISSVLKVELVHRKQYLTREAAKVDIEDYILNFYNPVRRHSSLDYLSPNQYEYFNKIAL